MLTETIEALLEDTCLNENQFNALVILAERVGVDAFKNSVVLRKVKTNPNDQMIKGAFLLAHPEAKQESDLYFNTIKTIL